MFKNVFQTAEPEQETQEQETQVVNMGSNIPPKPDRITDLIVNLLGTQQGDLYRLQVKVANLRERLLGIHEPDVQPEAPVHESHGIMDVAVYAIHDNNKILKDIEDIVDHLNKV